MDISRNINVLSAAFNTRNGKNFKKEFAIPFSTLPLSPSQDSTNILGQTQDAMQRMNIPILCRNKFNDTNLASAVSSRLETIVSLLANDPSRGNKIRFQFSC